jgi:hypothetical protein
MNPKQGAQIDGGLADDLLQYTFREQITAGKTAGPGGEPVERLVALIVVLLDPGLNTIETLPDG